MEQKQFAILLLAIIVGYGLYSNWIDADQKKIAAARPFVVKIMPINNSGQSGIATIKIGSGINDKKTRIAVDLYGASADVSQPASIYRGSCSNPGLLVHTLKPLIQGKSETFLYTPFEHFKTKLPLFLGIGKSLNESRPMVACGDIEAL